jgi:ferritin-like metal-binding protein YciE
MAKKNKTVRELSLEYEFLSDRILKLEEKGVEKHLNETKSKVEGNEEVLKSYDKKLSNWIN